MRSAHTILLTLVILGLGPGPAASGGGEAYRAWAGDLISVWESDGTHERGVDVTGFELAGLRLFMTYGEVIEQLNAGATPFEISETERGACVAERIESIKGGAETGPSCIESLTFTLRHGDGETAYVKAEFSEDVRHRPGESMVVKIEYTHDYGQGSVEIDDVYGTLAATYGHEPKYAHLKTYIGHYLMTTSYPNVEPEQRLPFLRMYLAGVGQISRYSLVLSAGGALRRDLEAEADRIVRDATRPVVYQPLGH